MADNIETYVLLAKQATGRALQTLVQQAIESPTIYSFTALLETPSVQALGETDDSRASLTLLQIFSYGTYRDYVNLQDTLPALGPSALRKLKQLSLVSMGNTSHHISYDETKSALDILETRELEDLVIGATYAGLVMAKLNTRASQVYMESTVGRDLDPNSSLDAIVSSLDSWSRTCESVLAQISSEVERIRGDAATRRREESAHAEAVKLARLHAKKENGGAFLSSSASAGKRREVGTGLGSGGFVGNNIDSNGLHHDEFMSDLNEDEEMTGFGGFGLERGARPSTRKRKNLMARR